MTEINSLYKIFVQIVTVQPSASCYGLNCYPKSFIVNTFILLSRLSDVSTIPSTPDEHTFTILPISCIAAEVSWVLAAFCSAIAARL